MEEIKLQYNSMFGSNTWIGSKKQKPTKQKTELRVNSVLRWGSETISMKKISGWEESGKIGLNEKGSFRLYSFWSKSKSLELAA